MYKCVLKISFVKMIYSYLNLIFYIYVNVLLNIYKFNGNICKCLIRYCVEFWVLWVKKYV